MLNRSQVWFAVFVVILFAAGVAAGVALDRTWGPSMRRPFSGFRGGMVGPGGGPGDPGAMGNRPGVRGGSAGRPTEMFVNELDEALKLTPDQKTKVAAIIDASRPRLRAFQDEVSKKFSDEQEAVTNEIAKVLTPDQAAKLRELRSRPRSGPFGFRGRGPRGR